MHPKTFVLKKPLEDYSYALELFLADVAKNGLRINEGQYVGTGVSNQKVLTSFSPRLIIISPKISTTTTDATIAGNMIFSLQTNTGISWVPGVGFKKDCVLSFQNNGFTIGNNSVINTANTMYLYVILG